MKRPKQIPGYKIVYTVVLRRSNELMTYALRRVTRSAYHKPYDRKIVEWRVQYSVAGFQFKTLGIAKHRARTNPDVKKFLGMGFRWEILMSYIPSSKIPVPVIISSSLTDTPLHRLAKAAK